MTTRQILIFCALTMCFVCRTGGVKLPPDVEKCKYGDVKCIEKAVNVIITKYMTGIKSINLISIDPLPVSSLGIEQGKESPVNIKLDITDGQIAGLSKTTVSKVAGFPASPAGSKNEFLFTTPSFILTGNYKIQGRVLVLPIQGAGRVNLTLIDTVNRVRFIGSSEIRDGKEYMIPKNLRYTFTTKRLHLHFSNLFNGDPQLGPATNAFLDENWEPILKELEPAVFAACTKIIDSLVTTVFGNIPYKDFFLE